MVKFLFGSLPPRLNDEFQAARLRLRCVQQRGQEKADKIAVCHPEGIENSKLEIDS